MGGIYSAVHSARPRPNGGIDPSQELVDRTTNAFATFEGGKAVFGVPSSIGKPFILGLVALPERLDARGKHVLDAAEATSIDLPLRVAGNVLRQRDGVEVARHTISVVHEHYARSTSSPTEAT